MYTRNIDLVSQSVGVEILKEIPAALFNDSFSSKNTLFVIKLIALFPRLVETDLETLLSRQLIVSAESEKKKGSDSETNEMGGLRDGNGIKFFSYPRRLCRDGEKENCFLLACLLFFLLFIKLLPTS